MTHCPFNPTHPATIRQVAELWNAACGQDLAISEHFVRFNLSGASAAEVSGCLTTSRGQPVGFVVVSTNRKEIAGFSQPCGWIDALAVLPSARRQGLGAQLLAWAENWLSARGCPCARLGGSLRPFAPGLPVQLGSEVFFLKRGYKARSQADRVWDVARCLDGYRTPAFVDKLPLEARPLQASETGMLDRFLAREFPGLWHFEFQEHLRLGGQLADYLALWSERGIDGFCQVTFANSARPIERFYPHGLPRPWGQLGPIGVSADRRGQGYGSTLLDAGLHYLRDQGVAGCVIDWTHLPAYYERFGFRRHREYAILVKELNRDAKRSFALACAPPPDS
jgi:predicted N-acetyltransferase YhbS